MQDNRKLIMVVDDDDELRGSVRYLLESLDDSAVVTASDGRRALNLLELIEPDLIVTDLMMPVLDGFGLLREYRSRGGAAPVLAASGMQPYLDRALEMGADAVLLKPFDTASFMALVRALCTSAERPELPPPPAASNAEVQRLRAILDLDLTSPAPDEELERFVQEVAAYFEVPTALFSVITADRQFWSAGCGIPDDLAEARGTPREMSFCTHAVTARAALVVQDTHENPFFRDNILVKAKGLRFYAGVPLIARHGEALGTLCLLDQHARTFTHKDLELLTLFGRRVLAALEWREHIKSPEIPRSVFPNIDYFDRDLQVFGAAGFRDLAIVEAARGLEADIPVACAVVAVPFRRLRELVDALAARYPRSLLGRLGHSRLGWLVPGHSATEIRETALAITTNHSFAEAVDLTRYIGATRTALYDLEQSLDDAGLA